MNIELFLHDLGKRDGTLKRIAEWNQLADIEGDKIKRFIFRWIAFNGLYSASYAMKYGQDKADREKEHKLIEYFNKKFILHDQALSTIIYSDAIEKVFKTNIKDKSNYMGTYLANLENEKNVNKKVCAIVMIAYKIRCRLFHGEKDPNLEVNAEVSEAADKVIEPILNHILGKNRNKVYYGSLDTIPSSCAFLINSSKSFFGKNGLN